jgi:hypothetical protein
MAILIRAPLAPPHVHKSRPGLQKRDRARCRECRDRMPDRSDRSATQTMQIPRATGPTRHVRDSPWTTVATTITVPLRKAGLIRKRGPPLLCSREVRPRRKKTRTSFVAGSSNARRHPRRTARPRNVRRRIPRKADQRTEHHSMSCQSPIRRLAIQHSRDRLLAPGKLESGAGFLCRSVSYSSGF